VIRKKILNTSEFKTSHTLNECLDGTGYYILPKQKVCEILDTHVENPPLSRKEKQSYNDASFDFVVVNGEGLAEFAVEFDGPIHEIERERDIRKNRLCHRAGLPLWRITDVELGEQEKHSILSFLVCRFLAHKREFQSIVKEIAEYVQTLSPEELGRLTEDGFADPSIDPTVEFDFRHPFPGTVQIAERLLEKYGVVSRHAEKHMRECGADRLPHSIFCEVELPSGGGEGFYTSATNKYAVSWVDPPFIGYKPLKENVVRRVCDEIQFSVLGVLPLEADYAPEESAIDYYCRTRKTPYSFQSIPGTSPFELVEHLGEYFAYKRIEDIVSKPPA